MRDLMTHRFRRFALTAALIVLGAWGLAACSKGPVETRTTLHVFGTLVEIVIRNDDPDLAQKAIAGLSADFRRMHTDWHAWEPGELSSLNQAFSEGRSMTVSPFLLPVIQQAKDLSGMSGGLFNPAIGKLIAIWGFHNSELPVGPIPNLDDVRALAAQHPSMADVVIDGTVVSSTNPAVSLDFGGFAKGTAMDYAMTKLKEQGITNAVINAGGDLNVLGDHGDRPWRAGIRHPLDWGVIASVEMRAGEGLYTSGNYERFREQDGVRYSHIIDPRTGMPVGHIVSASVIHESGALADAAATALSVAGPTEMAVTIRNMGLKYVLLVDKDGQVYVTEAMKARVRFDKEPPKTVIIPTN